MDPEIMVFDTNCVLCSFSVAFILAHERDHLLHFAGTWSGPGLALAASHGFSRADLDKTYLVITGDRALTRSDAALAVLAHLRAPWRWLRVFRAIPRPLRDAAYSAIARRRYRWFGQRQNCTIVPPTERARFLGMQPSTDDPPNIQAHLSP